MIVKSNDDLRQEAFAMQVGRYSPYSRGTHVRAVLMRTVARDPSPVALLHACVLRRWRGDASPPHALHRARDAVTRAAARGAVAGVVFS